MKKNSIEKMQAYDYLKKFRGMPIAACVKSVSRSGMSRRIEFYSGDFERIGWYIAKVIGYSYDVDKGMRVDGCGMDMVYHVINSFNYTACDIDNPNMTQDEKREKFGRIYNDYFFDADRYTTL